MKVLTNDCNHRLSKFVVADENDHAPAMPVINCIVLIPSTGYSESFKKIPGKGNDAFRNMVAGSKYSAYNVNVWPVPHIRLFGTA